MNAKLSISIALLALPATALQQVGSTLQVGARPRIAVAPFCPPNALTTPTWDAAIPFATPPCGAAAWPYGARYTPRGDRLYVPLFGGLIGNGGCRVLRLHPLDFNVLGHVTVGESPEDVAFVTFADGSLRLGFVTNSSASTVSVFNAADAVVATIPIPYASGGSWPTAFPFAMAVAPNQSTVYVGTLDGGGWVHAIDVATLTLDPARSIHLGAEHSAARMAFAGSLLVMPVTEYHAGFTGSTAKLVTVDPAQPQSLNELVLASSSTGFTFPSPQDCAVDCDGIVWLAGFDLGAVVYGIDPSSMTVLHALPTQTSNADGKFQSLGLSDEGMLVVGDLWTSELAVLDARRRLWLDVIDAASLPTYQNAPMEIEFMPDRATLLVPWAASDNLGVFEY